MKTCIIPLRSAAPSAAVVLAALLSGGAAPAQAQHGPAGGAPHGFVAEFERQFGGSASKLVALARAMPESAYGWSPGEGVASVARVYMHIARYNYMYPDENLGLTPPVPADEYGRWEETVTAKAEVVEILEASMEYVRSVAAEMRAGGAERPTTLYGRDVASWAVLFQLVTHMNEHLGQSIAYARMNDVVPPWSR